MVGCRREGKREGERGKGREGERTFLIKSLASFETSAQPWYLGKVTLPLFDFAKYLRKKKCEILMVLKTDKTDTNIYIYLKIYTTAQTSIDYLS